MFSEGRDYTHLLPYQLIQADIMYLFIAKIMGNKSPQEEEDSWADR